MDWLREMTYDWSKYALAPALLLIPGIVAVLVIISNLTTK